MTRVWPLLPGFHWRYHRLQQRRLRHGRGSVSPRVSTGPSVPSLWTNQPEKNINIIPVCLTVWIASFFPTGGRHSVSFNYVFVEGCYTVSDTHLFHRPERGLRLLVHLPDVGVLDGEDDKPSGVFSEQRFVFCLWTILTVWGFIFEAILQRARAQELNRKQLNIFFTSHSVWQGKLG